MSALSLLLEWRVDVRTAYTRTNWCTKSAPYLTGYDFINENNVLLRRSRLAHGVKLKNYYSKINMIGRFSINRGTQECSQIGSQEE